MGQRILVTSDYFPRTSFHVVAPLTRTSGLSFIIFATRASRRFFRGADFALCCGFHRLLPERCAPRIHSLWVCNSIGPCQLFTCSTSVRRVGGGIFSTCQPNQVKEIIKRCMEAASVAPTINVPSSAPRPMCVSLPRLEVPAKASWPTFRTSGISLNPEAASLFSTASRNAAAAPPGIRHICHPDRSPAGINR
jgi:hypothetical protein